jgi:hypothetical protein
MDLYEMNSRSLVYDAVAVFTFLTMPPLEEPVLKVLTISQSTSNPKQVHLSVADRAAKLDGF